MTSQREATRESSFVSVIVFTTSRLAIQLALMNLTVFSSFAGGGSLFSSFSPKVSVIASSSLVSGMTASSLSSASLRPG